MLKKKGFWLSETLLTEDQITVEPLKKAFFSHLC